MERDLRVEVLRLRRILLLVDPTLIPVSDHRAATGITCQAVGPTISTSCTAAPWLYYFTVFCNDLWSVFRLERVWKERF